MSEENTMEGRKVWVFVGERKGVGGVFSQLELAKQWIESRALSGVLTEYMLDMGAYEWAIAVNAFEPNKPEHRDPAFVGSFVSSKMKHHHFENGRMLA